MKKYSILCFLVGFVFLVYFVMLFFYFNAPCNGDLCGSSPPIYTFLGLSPFLFGALLAVLAGLPRNKRIARKSLVADLFFCFVALIISMLGHSVIAAIGFLFGFLLIGVTILLLIRDE